MLRSFKGMAPKVAESAFVSEAAYVIGDVQIGQGSSVWHGAVVHAASSIGSNVAIGHGAVVEAFRVGDNVLIGNDATLMATTEVGRWCIVAAGAVVLPGTKIPDRSFVVGAPARIRGEISEEQVAHLKQTLDLAAALVAEYRRDTKGRRQQSVRLVKRNPQSQ